jgi:hypothetical protein
MQFTQKVPIVIHHLPVFVELQRWRHLVIGVAWWALPIVQQSGTAFLLVVQLRVRLIV